MNNINTPLKKIYSLLILIFLFFLILINKTYSEEKIGSIVSLKEEVFAINAEGEKRLLDLYDEILLQDEIVTNELSTATVQYNDNSTIIIKKSSSFKVTDFNITGLKNIFLAEVKKGSVIIESGKIAKKNDGSMTIELPKMTLGIKGTRFNIENNPDGTSAVSLAEDSFGNVGTINISSAGKVKTLFDTEQVVSTNTETGFSERVKTDDEKKELVDVSNDLIEASSIDENVIQKNLEQKLLNGSLLDANGDGVIDASDIDVIKEGIKIEKQQKLDFIVDNSTGENTEFLSQVLNKSDEASIGQSMDKIFEINNDLVASVITNLANEDNAFLTTSNSEANNAIKEKIYTQMLSDVDGNNNNIALIGNIISKSDGATVERMINFVETSDANNEGANLSLKVLSSVADARSLNDVDFGFEGQAEVNRLMEKAVFSAANSEDGAIFLANIMTKGNEESRGMMMNTIGQVGETFADSTLALEVLSSMADTASFDDMNFEGEGKDQFDKMMETAVFSAANSEDGAMMLANVITKSDADTAGAMLVNIATVAANDPYSTLAAEVLSEVATTATTNNTYFDSEQMNQFNNLVDTVAYTNTVVDDEVALAATTTTITDDAAVTATDDASATDTTTTDDTLYDAAGFAFAPPYYHKDTGTMYNNAGFDKDGNFSTSSSGNSGVTYDGAGFSMDPPYYHRDTGTMYNNAGIDKYGNTKSGAYDANGFSTVTPFAHNVTGTQFDSGGLHRTTRTAYNPAGFDKDGNEQDNGLDANGFSTVTPFNHNVTGTQFDSGGLHRVTRTDRDSEGYNEDGYNVNGFNRAAQWDAAYDEIDNVSSS